MLSGSDALLSICFVVVQLWRHHCASFASSRLSAVGVLVLARGIVQKDVKQSIGRSMKQFARSGKLRNN